MLKTQIYAVDLAQYPKETYHPTLGEKLTLGDLHGNAFKLIYFLVMTQQIFLTRAQFLIFRRIYKHATLNLLTQSDIDQFHQTLSLAIFTTERHVMLRFIGDLLADRGGNDYLTLALLAHLHAKGFKIEILLSNHDLEFIGAYEHEFSKNYPPLSIIFAMEKMSLLRFIALKHDHHLRLNSIRTMIKHAYYRQLKLLSYDLNAADPNTLIIYTHAPVGLSTIEKIALFWGIPFRATTASDLAETIDRINITFSHTLKTKKGITTLYQPLHYHHCLQRLIWNRYDEQKEKPGPHKKNDYRILYVHGHDNNGIVPDHALDSYVINLDNELGKLSTDHGTLVIVISA